MHETRIKLLSFTPSEAEKITGLSVSTQRDWRRRGFLPSGDGHNKFDIFGLAEMWVLKLLSDRGIGPKAGQEFSDLTAYWISSFALQNRIAYDGNSKKFNKFNKSDSDGPPLVPVEAGSIREKLLQESAKRPPIPNYLSVEVMRLHPLKMARILPTQFFCWFANGTHRFDHEIEKFFNAKSNDYNNDLLGGPIIILDLSALGNLMVNNSNGPFVLIEDIDSS